MNEQIQISGLNNRDWCRGERTDPLRIAMIGLGGYAQDYILPAIEDSAFCDATTMVSSRRNKAERFADESGASNAITYEQYHDGVATDSYDAVYVATPPARHLEFVESAIEFDKHVLCEKPLESNPDRALALVRQCAAADIRLMVAYRLQADPHIRSVRDLVREGKIGDVTQIHGEFSYRILTEGSDQKPWRLDPELAGGGALMDIGVYPLNTSRFLLGSDPKSVQSMISSPDEGFEDVDEHVAFQCQFSDSVTVSCTASFNSYRGNSIQLIGTEGRIRIDNAYGIRKQRHITLSIDEATVKLSPSPINEIVEQCDYFADRVDSEAEFEPDGLNGLIDIVTLDSVYQADAENRTVSVPLAEYLDAV